MCTIGKHFALTKLHISSVEIFKRAIELEEKKQMALVSFYKKQIDNIGLDQKKRNWDTEVLTLKDQLEVVTKRREENLKALLELKVSWQQMENSKLADLADKERLKREYEEKERQHQAATILQNKIKTMYLSKLKKKRSKAGGKKKGKKKKKKS